MTTETFKELRELCRSIVRSIGIRGDRQRRIWQDDIIDSAVARTWRTCERYGYAIDQDIAIDGDITDNPVLLVAVQECHRAISCMFSFPRTMYTMRELADATGVSKSSVHRLVS